MAQFSPFKLPHSPPLLPPGGNPFLKSLVVGVLLPGWEPFSLIQRVGSITLISGGSMPIPDQILTFGFGPPIRAGSGLTLEFIHFFIKTPHPIGSIS